MLFYMGNGWSLNLITEWILTSQHWATQKKAIKELDKLTLLSAILLLKDISGVITIFIAISGFTLMVNWETFKISNLKLFFKNENVLVKRLNWNSVNYQNF